MSEVWEIRRASLHDRKALTAMFRAAAGKGDYAIRFLDTFILHGVLHVALDGDRIVGAMHYRECVDRSAWLGIARTHPDYQRRGVARAILESLASLAARSGLNAIRLWSEARNEAGQAAAKASGMREVARFTRTKAATRAGAARAVPVAFDTDLFTSLQGEPALRAGNGYLPYDWYFVPATPAIVHLLANTGAFHRVGGGTVVLSPTDDWYGSPGLSFGVVGGDPAKVLPAIRSAGKHLGHRGVEAYLPHDPAILSAARAAGFRTESWGKEAVVFERAVASKPRKYRTRQTMAEIAAGKREGYAALAALAGKHGHGHTGPHEDRWNP